MNINVLFTQPSWFTEHQSIIGVLITIGAMFFINKENRKRWLNDGYLKRKIELEIEIRKFLLGIKGNAFAEYYLLSDWYIDKNKNDNKEFEHELIYKFNKSFEALYKYLKKEEQERFTSSHDDKRIFSLMDEYLCYAPEYLNLFDEFASLCGKIIGLKTIYSSDDSDSQAHRLYPKMIIGEVNKKPEHFNKMISSYLSFQDIIEKILNQINHNHYIELKSIYDKYICSTHKREQINK